jgi:pre-mRNA-splicing factor ATP-dependent RNA helicase DHX16
MASLEQWAASSLHRLVGLTDATMASFFVSMARGARGVGDIEQAFRESSIPVTAEVSSFARELLERAQAPPVAESRKRERPQEEAPQAEPIPEEPTAEEPSEPKRAKLVEDEMDEQESIRQFEARLRARDEAKTRKVGAAARIEAAEEAARAFRDASQTEREELVPELRKVSRREYLKKREEQQLALLRDAVAFDEKLMRTAPLSEEEMKRYEQNKRLLALAEQRVDSRAIEMEANDRFVMPLSTSLLEAKGEEERSARMAILKERYQPDKDVVKTAGPQDWETQRVSSAIGSKGAESGGVTVKGIGGGEWDYVFEGQVDFVSTSTIRGLESKEREQLVKDELDKTKLDPSAVEEERKRVDETIERLKASLRGHMSLSAAEKARIEAEKERLEREKMASIRKSLPIFAYREDLLRAISEFQVLIVVGETGSGKTTQLPQYLHEVGYTKLGKVGCTQPRRVAAMSVSARVAHEMNATLGGEVGYQIRFEDCTSERTVIKYMTDGMLLREFLAEPDLRSYSVIMVDEAHERSLHTDVLLALIKDVSRFRDDLKVIIASATVDAGKFSAYFDNAPIFNIPGRPYEIDILYTKAPEANYIDAAILTTLQIHVTQDPPGDILVFCTGQEEIETAIELLGDKTRELGGRIRELIALPVYSALPAEQQAQIFEPTPEGARKVIFATNIAETSLTIEGIKYVIDTGFVKQNMFNPRTGIESLQVVPTSKAGAQQRAGRAGRTGPGKCFRLFTPWSFEHELPDDNVPEIQRTNLASVVLMLKSLGIHDLLHFDFMDPPPAQALMRALNQLYALGALNQKGELTRLGRRMAEFPTDPLLSKMILASEAFKCVPEALTVAGMLDVQNSVFFTPRDRKLHAQLAHRAFARGVSGDHGMLLNVYTQWEESGYSPQWCRENYVQARSMRRARDVRDQLTALCERVEIAVGEESTGENTDGDAVSKAITSGYFFNVGRLTKSGSYRTAKTGHTVAMHPSSVLAPKKDVADKEKAERRAQLGLGPDPSETDTGAPPPEWVVFHELVETSKEYMRCITPIQPAWLTEIAPHYFKESDVGMEEDPKVLRGKGKSSARS